MNPFDKKTADLTRDDLLLISKPLGTAAMPYPAMTVVIDENGNGQNVLGAIDTGLVVYSDRPHDEVVGRYLRDMAIPSLLHVQQEGILRRNPNSRCRILMIEGDAGSGKSFMAKLHASTQNQKGQIVVDCGGRHISDLVFETVLDYGDDIRTAINAKLENGLASEGIRKMLSESLGAAYAEKGGKGFIDWDNIGLGNAQKTGQACEILKKAAYLLGLETQGGGLGIRMQEGPLIRAFREGRNILLDEYTKSIVGSDDSVQTVLQFLNGEVDEATFENKMKINGRTETFSFTFRREDMKPGFFVDITGNFKKDGISTHDLSRSAYSRLDPFSIEGATPLDWRHRVSQLLTGVPLSTLYAVQQDYAAKNAQAFSQALLHIRTMGLSQEKARTVPSYQLTLLKNWDRTLEAVVSIADFYSTWAQLIDPESKLLEQKEYGEILDEIDEAYRDRMCIDFRKVKSDIEKALVFRPEVKMLDKVQAMNPGAITATADFEPPAAEEPIIALGSRLSKVLLNRIMETTAGKPKLRTALLRLAADKGIIDATIKNAKRNDSFKPLSALLNQDEYEAIGGTRKLALLRQVICNNLRAAQGVAATLSATDEKIISLNELSIAVSKLLGATRMAAAPGHNPLIVPTADAGRITTEPFSLVEVLDSAAAKPNESPIVIKGKELMKTADLVTAFTMPAFGTQNRSAVWSTAITDSGYVVNVSRDSAVSMAENSDKTELATTTIVTRNEAGTAEVCHILQDNKNNQTLLVGSALDHRQEEALREAGITYVSREDSDARDEIQGFIEKIMTSSTRARDRTQLTEKLRAAFLLRNGDVNTKGGLADLLASKNLPCQVPIYVTLKPFVPA